MRSAAGVIEALRRTGQLWESGPGLVGLRGDVLQLFRWLDGTLERLAADARCEAWSAPPALPFATLAQADYFASFPQWLTAASHLDGDARVLEHVAAAEDPAAAACAALRPAGFALQPAVCYHVYAALAGSVVDGARTCTIGGTCWRHEGGRFAPLERGWAFTMRELVCVGSAHEVACVRSRGLSAATALAERLGLRARVEPATDPFFAPTTRGRALLQRLRGLKDELLLPVGYGRTVAAASFNDHAGFFGEAFGIRLRDGSPAATGCVAFGVERWLLALLVEHGTDARGWPVQPVCATSERDEA